LEAAFSVLKAGSANRVAGIFKSYCNLNLFMSRYGSDAEGAARFGFTVLRFSPGVRQLGAIAAEGPDQGFGHMTIDTDTTALSAE
jgi:hypothetical protein